MLVVGSVEEGASLDAGGWGREFVSIPDLTDMLNVGGVHMPHCAIDNAFDIFMGVPVVPLELIVFNALLFPLKTTRGVIGILFVSTEE